ncbi:MAG: 50S ribosomal protein L30 [Methanobacteriales archaeon Met13]
MLAAIRVRGTTGIKEGISDTLDMLRLTRINHAVLLSDHPSYWGMLRKAKDYITWGEIDQETLTELIQKRGMLPGREKVTEEYLQETDYKSVEDLSQALIAEEAQLEDAGLKPIFRLHPPRKGYKNTKKAYGEGGTLGYRGEEINPLLKRMM